MSKCSSMLWTQLLLCKTVFNEDLQQGAKCISMLPLSPVDFLSIGSIFPPFFMSFLLSASFSFLSSGRFDRDLAYLSVH